jgi:hypothetical protein
MLRKLLRETVEGGRRLGLLPGLRLAHAERIEHLGRPRRRGVILQEPLPCGERLVALARLPERFAEKVGRFGRLGLARAVIEKPAQVRGGGGIGRGRRRLLRRLERSAAELPAGQRDRGGVGLARHHRLERLGGGLPVAGLELADGEVVAALEGERVLGMGGDQGLPLLGGQIPGLAVLQGGGRRVGHLGRVTRRRLLGRRDSNREPDDRGGEDRAAADAGQHEMPAVVRVSIEDEDTQSTLPSSQM